MIANVEELTRALQQEGALEADEDRLSEAKGELVRQQLEALGDGDNETVERLSAKIHELDQRRRAVRA